MYYMISPTGSDLYHHGILGQKWGRKNGPPYPLGASDHSAAEKKAGWTKSIKKLQNRDGSLTKRGNRKFKKVIELQNEGEKINKERQESIKKESDYLKKSGYLKGNGENYKEARKDLYSDDKNFRSIVDKVNREDKTQSYINNEIAKEMDKISNSKYSAFTNVGWDRTRQILENYDLYNKSISKQNPKSLIDIGKKSNDHMLNTAKNDSKTISKQVSKELVNDLIRWNKDGSDNYMSGKDSEKVRKHIEDAVKKNVENASNPYDFKNGTYDFVIDGIDVYSDYAPLTITYNPEKKKVVRIDYT